MKKIEKKYDSFYKWLKSNIKYTENDKIFISVGRYNDDPTTLYGNYQKFCEIKNLSELGLNHFSRLILDFFIEKNKKIEIFIDKKKKYIKNLELIEKYL